MQLRDFDTTLTQLVQSLPDWMSGVMHAASFVGQPLLTIPLVVGLFVYGIYTQNRRLAVASGVAAATFAFNGMLKLLFQRERPETADFLAIQSFSFPSGHASSALVIFGLVALIAWYYLPRLWAVVSVGFITLLIVVIGVSRVYLGAHYPSDVLAGWGVGAIGLLTIAVVVRPRL